MSERKPPTPPPDPLLQAYREADSLLGNTGPADAVRERVLAAALAARQ